MNKIVIVSGASSGIGYSIAKLLHENSFKVIGISRNYPKQPYAFEYQLVNISKEDEVNSFAQRVEDEYGHIFALINCAGMGISGAVEYTSLSSVHKIFDVNVLGAFLMTKAFIPLMRNHKGTKIINISSVAADIAIPFQTFYSMTKASINAFTKALALELKPFGISVGAIMPGDTATGFTQNREKSDPETHKDYGTRITRSVRRMEKDEQNGKNPITVAKICLKMLNKKHMPLFRTVGLQYKLFVILNRILPQRLIQYILYKMYAE
jgi:short-subunit dehydrogenase